MHHVFLLKSPSISWPTSTSAPPQRILCRSGQSQSKQTSETKVNNQSNGMGQVGSSSTTQSTQSKTASTKTASTKPSQKKTKRTSVERVAIARDAAEDSRETDEFHNICMSVFENADVDRDGQLDKREFFSGSTRFLAIYPYFFKEECFFTFYSSHFICTSDVLEYPWSEFVDGGSGGCVPACGREWRRLHLVSRVHSRAEEGVADSVWPHHRRLERLVQGLVATW